MFLVLETLETYGKTRKDCFRNKNVSEVVWKQFCFGNHASRGGQTRKHHRNYSISATMFSSLPRVLNAISRRFLIASSQL